MSPGTDEETGLTATAPGAEQGLYGNSTFFWPAAVASRPATVRTDIAVCWENPDSTAIAGTAAARATWREDRRRALEESWARTARINFTGWGTCTNNAAGIHIVACNDPDTRCPEMPSSQAGGGYPAINGLNNGIRMNPDHGASVIVHEFGHALGFYHEEERFNTTQNLPTQACDTSGGSGYINGAPTTFGAYDSNSIMAYCNPPTGAPWLSPSDITGIQRSYGRRQEGSLVSPRANCVAAHAAVGSGDVGFLWDCDEYANDQEYVDVTTWSDGDAWNLNLPGTSLCMEPWSNNAGANVTLYTCSSSSTSYDWRFEDMFVRGFGGLCLDLIGGNTAAGTGIQVWSCGALGGSNQRWTRTRSGQLRFGATSMCASINTTTNRLVLASCNSADANQLFGFGNGKIWQLSQPGQCLDVSGPSDAQYAVNGTGGSGLPTNGAPVGRFTCNTSFNQRWWLNGALRTGGNASLCMARGADADGSGLTLATCNGSHETQEWDYYF